MADVISCCLCKERIDRRRSLHTVANHNVVLVLSSIVNRIFGRSSVGVVLPALGSICRPCLRCVEKLVRLQKEVSEKEEFINLKVKQAGLACGLTESHYVIPSPRASGSIEGATPTRKRRRAPCADEVSGTPTGQTLQVDLVPVAKRRVNFANETPVRQFLSSVVPSEDSPAVAVVVKSAGKRKLQTRVVHKSSNLKTLVKSVGRLNYASVARQAMKVTKIRSKVLPILAATIQKELTQMCARKNKSVLRDTTPKSVKSSWKTLLCELGTHAPIFTQVLRGIMQVKRRIRTTKPRKKSSRPSEEAVVGVCAAEASKCAYESASTNCVPHPTQWTCFKTDLYSATKAVVLTLTQAKHCFS